MTSKLTKKELKNLGCFCLSCGGLLGKRSIAGGRCVSCGTMITSATEKQLKAEFAAASPEIQLAIKRRLSVL